MVRRDELNDERCTDPPDLLLERYLSPAADAHGPAGAEPHGRAVDLEAADRSSPVRRGDAPRRDGASEQRHRAERDVRGRAGGAAGGGGEEADDRGGGRIGRWAAAGRGSAEREHVPPRHRYRSGARPDAAVGQVRGRERRVGRRRRRRGRRGGGGRPRGASSAWSSSTWSSSTSTCGGRRRGRGSGGVRGSRAERSQNKTENDEPHPAPHRRSVPYLPGLRGNAHERHTISACPASSCTKAAQSRRSISSSGIRNRLSTRSTVCPLPRPPARCSACSARTGRGRRRPSGCSRLASGRLPVRLASAVSTSCAIRYGRGPARGRAAAEQPRPLDLDPGQPHLPRRLPRRPRARARGAGRRAARPVRARSIAQGTSPTSSRAGNRSG